MVRFTTETAGTAGQKSIRGRAKRDSIVPDAMEILLTEGNLPNHPRSYRLVSCLIH